MRQRYKKGTYEEYNFRRLTFKSITACFVAWYLPHGKCKFLHSLMHMDISDEQSLINAGVRVTAVRLLIWRQVRHGFDNAFSLSDLEEALPTVDRSTLFRTLTLLADAHLLHDIDDGSGKQKYCVCHVDDTRHCTGHVHLTCRLCHRTFCLSNVRIPMVALPDGFQPEETEYLIKGICAECSKAQSVDSAPMHHLC